MIFRWIKMHYRLCVRNSHTMFTGFWYSFKLILGGHFLKVLQLVKIWIRKDPKQRNKMLYICYIHVFKHSVFERMNLKVSHDPVNIECKFRTQFKAGKSMGYRM